LQLSYKREELKYYPVNVTKSRNSSENNKYYNKSFFAVRADLQSKLKISNINLTCCYSGLLELGFKTSA